jgi:hypothetical protein
MIDVIDVDVNLVVTYAIQPDAGNLEAEAGNSRDHRELREVIPQELNP